jgi:hypothetical protein
MLTVNPDGLSEPEQRLWDAYPDGASVDLRSAGDNRVHANVIRMLLLGARTPGPGQLPGMELYGAQIMGPLDLAFADIRCSVRLEACHFDHPMDFYGARMRRLSLSESVFPGFTASRALIDGNLQLTRCKSTDKIRLFGARVAGGLLLDRAQINSSGIALDGTLLEVASDIVGQNGFECVGSLRLLNAKVGGALRLEAARLSNPGGVALDARNLTVGLLRWVPGGRGGAATLRQDLQQPVRGECQTLQPWRSRPERPLPRYQPPDPPTRDTPLTATSISDTHGSASSRTSRPDGPKPCE